ncbi:MAG: cobalt-precorrin-5B (C(1))-methyltransferase CbiD [Lachnospiraceae bacterium]|nr:cobalt-precorrin-5B (C(1))-methyltransferase CbiD [Lachnospiraceae bacterium]
MKKNKKLRCGYTTGSCAAAAAKAATEMLLSGRICYRADLLTPKGIRLHLPVEEQEIADCQASCAVKKYGGDDPDATNGILVYARAEYLTESETGKIRVLVDGGVGVGRVTKPGLEQEVGAAAINRVPREMITKEVERICELYEYPGRIKITISVPDGVEIAKRTFNPHLGIQGGISILGTSGIVVPMSEDALIASIRVEMKQKIAGGEQYLLITPGNYGADFIRRQDLPYAAGGRNERAAAHSGYAAELPCASGDYDEASETQMERKDRSRALDAEHSMKCSNYVGETLDIAEELGARGILFVAHIGKFIKVSGGIMNTHSAHADCRAELMAAQAMRAGIPPEIAGELLDTNTTEEAVGILIRTGWLKPVMEQVTERVKYHLQKHCRGAIETEAIIYSNQYGYLGETDGADEMIKKIAAQ